MHVVRVGDQILRINGKYVTSHREAIELLRQTSGEVLLMVKRGGQERALTFEKPPGDRGFSKSFS